MNKLAIINKSLLAVMIACSVSLAMPVAHAKVDTTANNTEKVALESFKEKGKWGYKRNGKVFILPQYDDTWSFNEGLASVKKDGKWGFINKKGECVKDCD